MIRHVAIFAGTFDPVHEGHVAFVEAADAQLCFDEVLIIPEKKPRSKRSVTALEHREAMLRLAFSNNEASRVVAISSDFAKMPETIDEQKLEGSKVYLLIGTDVALTLKTWAYLDKLIQRVILVVGIRNDSDAKRIHTLMQHLGIKAGGYYMIKTPVARQSSSLARLGTTRFYPKIATYIQKHHLYTL